MSNPVVMIHYTAPPVVGGVEAVMDAHARLLVQGGYALVVAAGRGEQDALPAAARLASVPEMDSQHPAILAASAVLEEGQVPGDFEGLVDLLLARLRPLLSQASTVIVHNVFTKHFNLPLTAALAHLLDDGTVNRCIAWCHDFTWTSANSRDKVHPGYPWDLLRTRRQDMDYVVVSQHRQQELAGLFGCSAEEIRVIYNGVDPQAILGLSQEGLALMDRLDLLDADLVLLMPVRVTRAKNIEFALHTVAALKEKGRQPRLVLSGPPDPHDPDSMAYFEQLRALRRDLGVEPELRFVFESGPDPEEPYRIDLDTVGDLFRLADVMFMPSHREGFGMPILEAGLAALPVVASSAVPAATEIGRTDAILFDPNADAADVAQQIIDWAENSPTYRLRRRVRQRYTWQAIFDQDIEPMLAPP